MTPQELLDLAHNQVLNLRGKNLDDAFDTLLGTYKDALLVRGGSKVIATTLFTQDRTGARVPTEVACPRDNPRAVLRVNEKSFTGFEACTQCQNALLCAMDGGPRTFQRISARPLSEVLAFLNEDS